MTILPFTSEGNGTKQGAVSCQASHNYSRGSQDLTSSSLIPKVPRVAAAPSMKCGDPLKEQGQNCKVRTWDFSGVVSPQCAQWLAEGRV